MPSERTAARVPPYVGIVSRNGTFGAVAHAAGEYVSSDDSAASDSAGVGAKPRVLT